MKSKCQASQPQEMGRGFTLIELLVVMSIISLLVAILLPALSVAREVSIRTRCASNLRQLAGTMLTYEQDFKVFPSGDFQNMTRITNTAHATLRDSYGLPMALVTCPGASPVLTVQNLWANNASTAQMYYNYFAGHGGGTTAVQLANDGWNANVGTQHFYLGPQGLRPVLNVGKSYWPSKHPFGMDVAYYNETTISSAGVTPAKPARSNHPTGSDPLNSGLSENIMFLDGHVEWHVYQAGVSWKLGGDTPDRFWWSANWTLPGYQTTWIAGP